MKSDSSEILFKHLQKSFLQLESLFSRWQEDNKKAETQIKSIRNLLDQLRTCERVTKRDVPENVFTVKPLLIQKIRCSLEGDIEELKKDSLPRLERCRAVAEKLNDDCYRVYTELSSTEGSSIDVAVLTRATATRPSISDMLEWLDQFQRYFREEYQGKSFFAENVTSCDAKTINELEEHWKSHDLQTHLVQNIWPYLQYFLHDDIVLKS